MKTAYITFNSCLDNNPSDENFKNVGINTGNLAFDYSLKSTIKCEAMSMQDFLSRSEEFDNLVSRDFIWIKESTDMSYFSKVVEKFKKPIIPISVGLQSENFSSDFKLNANTKSLLLELSERAKLGVRGEYTAVILNKNGIKNIEIIGCPSLFLYANYGRKIYKKNFSDVKRIISNYKTLSDSLNEKTDIDIIHYLKEHSNTFMEQTKCYFSDESKKYIWSNDLDFLVRHKHIFFCFPDWLEYAKTFDFSIGARFHGNVVQILAGVPSLVLTFDSRTKELTDYFNIPTLDIEKFDIEKSLEYYYELADYSDFNKNYPKKLDNFINFCFFNNLELNYGQDLFLYRQNKKMENLLKKTHELLADEIDFNFGN